MTLFWGRVECEAAVGSNVRSVPSTLQPVELSEYGSISSMKLWIALDIIFQGYQFLLLQLHRQQVFGQQKYMIHTCHESSV